MTSEASASDASSSDESNAWADLPPLRCQHGRFHCEDCEGDPFDANAVTVDVESEADLAMSNAALEVSNHGPPALSSFPPAEQDQHPFVPSAAQDQRSMAISAAVSAQLADAVYAEVRGEQERARSMAISAAISTEVADAVHAEVRGQQERAREHERQLRSEAISAAVEKAAAEEAENWGYQA